jgi:hypothetical protein
LCEPTSSTHTQQAGGSGRPKGRAKRRCARSAAIARALGEPRHRFTHLMESTRVCRSPPAAAARPLLAALALCCCCCEPSCCCCLLTALQVSVHCCAVPALARRRRIEHCAVHASYVCTSTARVLAAWTPSTKCAFVLVGGQQEKKHLLLPSSWEEDPITHTKELLRAACCCALSINGLLE